MVCGPDDPYARLVGARLTEALRHYNMPKEAGKAAESYGQDHAYQDFREAPLDEAVRKRLAGSSFLLVICVPSTKTSEAISQRLDYFSGKLGRDDKIIAVLAKGEPEESFPHYFIQTRPDGSIRDTTETIEPLTADLRGKSEHERRHALAIETIRIVATMAGIPPYVLEQRHEKRRKKRITTLLTLTGSIVAAAVVVFSLLGFAAVREGEVAEKQTELSSAMADRLFAELPQAFQDEPLALEYIDDAILDGLDSLLAAGSSNARLIDLDTALAVTERDSAADIMRKASIWRRSGEWDRAMELYKQGISASDDHVESFSELFFEHMNMLKSHPESESSYALYILQTNSHAPLEEGDLIIEIDGKPLYNHNDYTELLSDTMPGGALKVTALYADRASGAYKTIKLTLSIEQLNAFSLIQV